MINGLPADISLLWQQFQTQAIAPAEWTHEAHLKVAIAANVEAGEQALERMREGIVRLNAVHGVPLTPQGGYHETLTTVWCTLVSQALSQTQSVPEILDRLADKRLPLNFYSRERLLSWEARIGWLEPDLAPIQAVAS